MNRKVLKTEEDYKAAVKRTIEIFHAEGDEAEELDLLLVLVKDYEDKHIRLPQISRTEMHQIKIRDQRAKGRYPAYTLLPTTSAGTFSVKQKRTVYTNTTSGKKPFLPYPGIFLLQELIKSKNYPVAFRSALIPAQHRGE